MQTEKKAEIVEAFRRGLSWRECGLSCSIDPSTIWRWAKADPDFAAAIKEACAEPDDEVEAIAFANATDPDPAHNTLRMFWLKSRRPSVYRERLDVTSGEKPFGYIERGQNPRDADLPPPAQAE